MTEIDKEWSKKYAESWKKLTEQEKLRASEERQQAIRQELSAMRAGVDTLGALLARNDPQGARYFVAVSHAMIDAISLGSSLAGGALAGGNHDPVVAAGLERHFSSELKGSKFSSDFDVWSEAHPIEIGIFHSSV